jgi:hypothetical protein
VARALPGSGSAGSSKAASGRAPSSQRRHGLLEGGACSSSSKVAVVWADDGELGSGCDEARSELGVFYFKKSIFLSVHLRNQYYK